MPVTPRPHRRSRPIGALAAAGASVLAALVTGCSGSSGSTQDFCREVRRVPALESVLARFSETDPDVLADRIDKARDAYGALADAAPDEIRDETEDVVELVDEVLDAVADHPDDPAKASAQLRGAMAAHRDVEASRRAVTAYAAKACDVELDAAITPPSAASTSGD